jgi:hypothetical protein
MAVGRSVREARWADSPNRCRPFELWLSNDVPACRVSPWCGSKRRDASGPGIRHARRGFPFFQDDRKPLMAAVMIGVDPHKASHTAVAINAAEEEAGAMPTLACHQAAGRSRLQLLCCSRGRARLGMSVSEPAVRVRLSGLEET